MAGHPIRVALCASLLVLGTSAAIAQTTAELKRMSLEELMSVSVSTFSRVPEPSNRVPAAVFVLMGDDIRRSGATSLPERHCAWCQAYKWLAWMLRDTRSGFVALPIGSRARCSC